MIPHRYGSSSQLFGSTRMHKLVLLAPFVFTVCLSAPARAGIVTTNPDLPPLTGQYVTPGTFATYATAIGTIVISDMEITPTTLNSRVPSGADEIENFNVTFTGAGTLGLDTVP